MMGWLIGVIYVGIWLVFGWRHSVALIDEDIRELLQDIESTTGREMAEWGPRTQRLAVEYARNVDRGGRIAAAFLLMLFWPISLPIIGILMIVHRTHMFRTPIERELSARVELDRLRKQAAELGLPMTPEAYR